jgi:hypothetical protein
MSLIEKIKLLFAAKAPVTDLISKAKELKTGWKTLGFWVSVVATLATLATAVAGFLPANIALIVTVAITFIYQTLRAVENTQMASTAPLLLSTRFWSGILAIAATALTSLKAGGISPHWVEAALTLIGIIMTGAQNVGGQLVPPAEPAAPAK